MTIRFGTDGWRAVISETFTFGNLRLLAQAARRQRVADVSAPGGKQGQRGERRKKSKHENAG